MITVCGATGMVGSEIVRRLAGAGKPVRAMVRSTSDPAKVEKLKQLGAEIVQGDLRDQKSLDAACRGAAAVIDTVSAVPFSYVAGNTVQTVDLEGATSLIAAAQAAKVQHFIYTSFSGNIDLDFPLRNAKRTVEKRLRDSGLTYTILRPSYFMDVWLSPIVGFDFANAKAAIYGAGQNPVSWISFGDVAQFAVASLDNPAARNATLEMGGPEALSPLQVVRIFEEVGGRNFDAQHVPEDTLQAQRQAATDPMQQSFSGLMLCLAHGDGIDMRSTLKAFPLKMTTVHEYAERVLAPQAPAAVPV